MISETESDFATEYPDLIPYIDDKAETSSIYVLSDELGESAYYYDKAVLKFESGLLTWIARKIMQVKTGKYLRHRL